jgi:hypothetical protein
MHALPVLRQIAFAVRCGLHVPIPLVRSWLLVRALDIFLYMICHVANGFCVPLPTWPICRRCLQFRQSSGKRRKPRKPGAIGRHTWRGSRCSARILTQETREASVSKPKIGRSPLRMAMRLLAVRRRSIEAIRRPSRVLEGMRPIDIVRDMDVPFLKWRSNSAS